MSHYTTALEINRSNQAVFAAISKELGAWWGHQDNLANQIRASFKVSWGEPWYQFRVINYVEHLAMTWECIDANQIIKGLDDVQKEWVGTKVHWKLEPLESKKTRLIFKHEGLVPDFICFQVCSTAWSDFLHQHLVAYLKKTA